ncbi:hypothetical protein GCM10010441_26540 [Kitasatospora paracochleata]|uniref:DUF5054 domain-containing protein n=1 Tax=Kitasatospora paracochleata TaxID=58354 RepID=A0ABT1IWP1_9ACTN|nr:DUF5054 domain-containing protein [Kitasatospora paracochleata]MCP2309374.1 hypothetical protein [Kitasatospora paracochleata]
MLRARRVAQTPDPAARAAAAAGLTRVHVVFKTHLDLGFTDLAVNVLSRYRDEFIPAAIRLGRDLLDSTGRREFIWTTGSWLIAHALEHGTAAQRADLDAAIRDGIVAWHALPFTSQTELMTRATIEHGLEVSRRLDARYGRETCAGKMTDVPGHTIGLVPPMAAAGVRYLHLGVNPASPVPDVPDHFVWRAPGGDEIVVSYDPGYGSEPETALVRRLPGSDEALFLAFTNDNHGPPTREGVEHLLAVLREQYPDAEVGASTLDAFGRVAWAARDHLPVVDQEIGDTWIYGAAADPILTSRLTRLQRLRDRWLADGRLARHGQLDWALADELAVAAEHTWGCDVKRYLPDYTVYTKADFRAARERDKIDLDQSVPPTLGHLRQWAPGPFGYAVTLASFDEKRAYTQTALDLLPIGLRAEADAELVVAPAALPADATEVHGRAVSDDIELEIDAHGALIALTVAGRRLLAADPTDADPRSHGEVGAYSYVAYGASDEQRWLREYVREPERHAEWAFPDLGKPGLDLVRPERVTEVFRPTARTAHSWTDADGSTVLRVTAGMPARAAEEFGAPRAVTLEYRVSRGDALRLGVTAYLQDKDAFYGPEASWLHLRPIVPTPSRWRLLKSGVPVNPLDVVRDGGRALHAAHGLEYADAQGSVRITPLDTPVLAVGGPRMFSHDNTFGDPGEGFGFCLHNNVWGTNYRQWFEEDQRAEFVLEFRS